MPTDAEVFAAACEFNKLVRNFGKEADYEVVRKMLKAAERERLAAAEMRAGTSGEYEPKEG